MSYLRGDMLVFIVPLKSPQASKSWEHVSKLFERCVKSVCNQTSPEFRVIVVCNSKPCIEFSHPHITYIEVDFPVPPVDFDARTLDKGRKVVTGLIFARKFHPSYTMSVDADDCVSKYLAEFVNQNSQGNGWFVNKGYEYQDGSKHIDIRRKDFYKVCGTSSILDYNLYNLPETVKYERLHEYYIVHAKVREAMSEKKMPIEPLPFSGAVYISARNGENITLQERFFEKLTSNPRKLFRPMKKALFQVFTSTSLTSSIRDEFGIYDIHASSSQHQNVN